MTAFESSALRINKAVVSAREAALVEPNEPNKCGLLSKVVGAQVHAGDWEGACYEVVRAVHLDLYTRYNNALKGQMLAEMAKGQLLSGDIKGALVTIHHGLGLGLSTFSFFQTLCQLVTLDKLKIDESTANAALDLAQRTSAEQLIKAEAGDCSKINWLTYLAEAQARMGRRDTADHTIQSALDLVSSTDFDFARRQKVIDCGYYDVVGTQARMGDIPGALLTLKHMRDGGLIDSGMRDIALAVAKAGDLAEAFAFVRQIGGSDVRSQALIWIAESQARGGDSGEAKTIIERIESPAKAAEGLIHIAIAEAQCGDREHGKETLASALQIVDEARLCPWLMTETYAAVGLGDKARDAFERESGNRGSLARMITKGDVISGNRQAGEAWAKSRPSTSEQCYAWLGIVDGLILSCQKDHTSAPLGTRSDLLKLIG